MVSVFNLYSQDSQDNLPYIFYFLRIQICNSLKSHQRRSKACSDWCWETIFLNIFPSPLISLACFKTLGTKSGCTEQQGRGLKDTFSHRCLRRYRGSKRKWWQRPITKWNDPGQVMKYQDNYLFDIKNILSYKIDTAHGRQLTFIHLAGEVKHHFAHHGNEILPVGVF